VTPPDGLRPGEQPAPPSGRMPERDRRAGGKRRLSNAQVGLIAIALLALGTYMAFAKQIPLRQPRLHAPRHLQNAVNIRADSPVRIAGVNVAGALGEPRRK